MAPEMLHFGNSSLRQYAERQRAPAHGDAAAPTPCHSLGNGSCAPCSPLFVSPGTPCRQPASKCVLRYLLECVEGLEL